MGKVVEENLIAQRFLKIYLILEYKCRPKKANGISFCTFFFLVVSVISSSLIPFAILGFCFQFF